ncbi:MAG: response regulator [Deltaproteobacteria bacterium]|nr:response regulator [Deltaproteobacteria bacterium]MBI3391303.1 response regulator [Deltaproteobacteria bacterium]
MTMTVDRSHLSSASQGEQVEIILVEDNPDDVELIRRALRRGHICNPIVVASDGDEALSILRRLASDRPPRPRVQPLVLLDLNLPRLDGRALLQQIWSNPALSGVPIIVMVNSDADAAGIGATALGVVAFVRKPVDADAFVKALSNLGHYGLDVVRDRTEAAPPRAAGRSTD